MDLIYLFKSLIRRKWFILFSTLFAIVAAFLLTLNQERMYKSVAQMATGFTTNDVVKLKDENFNIYEIDVKFNNVVEALQSSKVLSMVAYTLLLHDLEHPEKPYRHLTAEEKKEDAYRNLNIAKAIPILKNKYSTESLLSSYDPEERKIQDALKLYKYDLETMRKLMYAGRVQRTDYIDIQYRSVQPELAAYVVNQLCAEFLRGNESSRTLQTVQSIETLSKLVEQKREELDAKLSKIKTQGSLDVSLESTSKLGQISNFENKLADENATLNVATMALQQINTKLAEMERTNAQTSSSTSSANAELSNLRNQKNSAYNEYVNKGSNDQELYAKYVKLKNDYNAKLSSMASAAPATGSVSKADLQQRKSDLEVQISSARQNIAQYQQSIRGLNSQVGAAASRGATNVALQKELDMAQQEYENIKSRYDAAMNNKIAPQDNFRQTLYGQPAVEPEPSKRLIIVALSGMCMFLFGCVLVILLEYIDVSIKTPSHFLRAIDLRLLSVLNKLNLKKTPLQQVFQVNNAKNTNAALFLENMRKLRYEIESQDAGIFLFTSTRNGEGKTTIIKALAQSFSLSRKKVLIIDTNFSNNTLTRDFNAMPELENFQLAANSYHYDKIKPIITTTDIEGVDIIGCAGGDYTPAEILGADNLLLLLPHLRKTYDYILLEGAALNQRSDSKELLHYTEMAVSIVAATSTIKQTDKESIQFLQTLNGKFAGAVLNNVQYENMNA
ncbi:GumC family protein [Chitinophaga nivalis]|uniref:Wzz/FepE/Etk N-terminal domain-containing protein n=1 Tax=Chitinophaga nivalis TaxID=2991709 RepID=A0ABT3ILN7_9BACT|nr:Wzz/FepE/Etk N-terminal domain-containing protein [Chitinophaga nivalis]MCW3465411.1 Wzz/FepE/Etk N-terminal domain-containing protein [Chitinophaga nivalis]MCW3484897.1 Wzz/FepE/Etk N-terminal domain-containing protein [Chitinophaga nivalis]